ncbi:MarR family winged helix-turn-helix transcriptional regulator [Paenibacillus thailandensis]|uniref:MarR family winged helix-turn-helix transcriptional regulator n=1 Tax=Paenibacillus thailandensis TaxID=393250 RepID=A0ABW5QXM3_9BACL
MDEQISVDTLIQSFKEISKQLAAPRLKSIGDHLRRHELSLNQYSILAFVKENRHSSSSQLAAKLNLKAASITYLVDSLEKRGLVERMSNPEDRRSHYIRLTEAGEELIPIPEDDALLARQFEQLSADDKDILYLILRLMKNKFIFSDRRDET